MFNWKFHFHKKPKYWEKKNRQVLVTSYLGESTTDEFIEEALFDLEIGFLHRFVYVLLFKLMHTKNNEIELVEMGEMMVAALERGEEEKQIVEQGGHDAKN